MKNFNNSLRKVFIATFLIMVFLLQISVCAFAAEGSFFPQLRNEDPSQQMNKMKDLMEKKLLEESLQKDLKEYDKKAVDDNDVEKARKSKGSDLKFNIKEVRFTESTTLTKEELDKVSGPYVGKEVTLDQLYELVNAVNEIYRKKGYAVCRAFLPEQTIKDGVANITLVEGKTGKIKLDNVRFTEKGYVLSHTGLKHGEVNNLRELNRRISLFNATNDAQLAVKLAAGEEQGTTDYILTLDEPTRHTVYALSDLAGSESTGRFRYGLGWTINSPLGIRDTLSFSYMRTIDSDSGGASYSFPISNFGTRLSASVFGNTMQPTSGWPQEWRYHGDSTSYNIGLTQPLCVTPKFRAVFDFSWSKQYSDTKFRGYEGGLPMLYNTTNKYAAGVAFTHFGRGIVWYHRYSFTRATNFRRSLGASDYDRYLYWVYGLNFVRQQAFMNGHSFTIKLNGQYSPSADDMGSVYSSDWFYIGGSGSVRGYNESLIGSEHGFNVSLEYAMPFRKYRNLTPIIFVDYGKIYGPGAKAYDGSQLASAGLGLRWFNKDGKLNGTIWLGIPLVRKLNYSGGDTEVPIDSARIHFSVYGQFEDLLAHLFNKKYE